MSFVWTNTLLVGTGLFLLVYLALYTTGERILWWVRKRRRAGILRLDGMTTSPEEEDKPLSEEKGISWPAIYLIGGLLGILIYLWTKQIMTLGLVLSPPMLRAWITAWQRRAQEAETLDWLMDVRINLPLYGSLLRTMQAVSRGSRTQLALSTKRYLEAGFQGNGLELLERLAEETDLPYLDDLLARVRAATDGTLSIDRPFEHALERLRSEIYTQAREHQQRIPSRLTLLIFPVLLGPSIALLLFPPAARLIATIGGVGWGGGF